MRTSHVRIPAALLILAIFYGCGQQPKQEPAVSAEPHGHGDSAAVVQDNSRALQGQRAHELGNADGIVPSVEDDGTVLVGWDELVRNGKKYSGKNVHVRAIVGGTIPEGKGVSTGYLFPVDMDVPMMQALMEFTMSQPAAGESIPVRCTFDSKDASSTAVIGGVAVIGGRVKILKTGPGSGFTMQRGIQIAHYVVLQHARVVGKK